MSGEYCISLQRIENSLIYSVNKCELSLFMYFSHKKIGNIFVEHESILRVPNIPMVFGEKYYFQMVSKHSWEVATCGRF